jgi:hypothetical protein
VHAFKAMLLEMLTNDLLRLTLVSHDTPLDSCDVVAEARRQPNRQGSRADARRAGTLCGRAATVSVDGDQVTVTGTNRLLSAG